MGIVHFRKSIQCRKSIYTITLMSIKNTISEGRTRLQMTEQAFADQCGVSRSAVQHWERGLTAPNRARQKIVADVLGISVAQLMGGIDDDSAPRGSNIRQPMTLDVIVAELARMIERTPAGMREPIAALLHALVRRPDDYKIITKSLVPLIEKDTPK